MKVRNPRSYVIIFIYLCLNLIVVLLAFNQKAQEANRKAAPAPLAPEYTRIEDLKYFHLKNSSPQMSLNAQAMRSQGEELAEF